MAGAEVTVSSGDLMTVKEEEGYPSDNDHKTQVILHLQPILQGVNDAIADTASTVLAIETHHEDSKAEGEELEYGYPITCGNSRAVLLFKKFVCPGINVRCVKFNDQLISPKQFVHLAGKATLKDWKRAIRLGGVMLRKMMDSGQIDFYQHDTVCTNTCRSTKFDVLINSTRLPPGNLMQPSLSCLSLNTPGGQVPLLTGEVLNNAAEAEEPLEEKSSTSEWSPVPVRPVHPTAANGHAAKRKKADTPDGVLSLWQGVADAGLMGEVLSSLQNVLLATLKGVEVRSENSSLRETDAVILDSLCKTFGLLDSVKQTLDLKFSQDGVQNNEYELDEIMDDQRKWGCDKSTTNKTKSLKHLRPQHRNALKSQSPGFVSPVKTSPVIQPRSGTGLSAASCTQLSINPELLTHVLASTGQCHNARASRTDRNGHSATQEREQELNETGAQQKLHRFRQEAVKKEGDSGIHREPAERTQEDPHLSEEIKKKERFHDVDNVVIGGVTTKKHKSE